MTIAELRDEIEKNNITNPREVLKLMERKTKALEAMLERLLNKVNVVTCFHRHGETVSRHLLDELSDRQLTVESLLQKYKNGDTNETVDSLEGGEPDPT